MPRDEASNEQLFQDVRALRQQVAALQMSADQRIRELKCLNDIGRKIEERPSVSELLQWASKRIPSAVRYPDICQTAITFDGHVYGDAAALDLSNQFAQDLCVDDKTVGQLHIGYSEEFDLSDSELALLGDIARRLSEYIGQQHLAVALEVERRTLKSIVNSIPHGVFVVEAPSGKPLQMNHHARTLLGRGVISDATAETLAQVYGIHRCNAPGYYPGDEMPLAGAMSGDITTVDDVEVHRPDGSRVLLEMSGAPITDASGSVTAIVATLQDITERRETEVALERQARQLMTVAQVASAASRVAEPEQLAQEALDLVCEQLGMSHAGLFLIDQSGHWTGEPGRWAVLRAGAGEQGRRMVDQGYTVEIGGDTMVGQAVALGEARVARDLNKDQVHHDDMSSAATRSELALPLISRGETIGAVTFQSTEAKAFSERDVTVLQVMADQLASAIQNAQLFVEAQEAVQRVETLYETSRALSASLEEEPVIRAVLQTVDQRMGCEYAIVYTVDEEAGTIEGRHGIWDGEYDDFPHWIQLPRYSLDQAGVLTEVYRRGQTEIRGGWSDRFDREIWGRLGRERLLRIYAPIAIRKRVIGVVEIGYDRQSKSYIADDEARLLAAFVDQAAVALENARLFQQIHRTLEEMEVLNALSSAVSRSLEPTEVLYEALKQVLALTDLDAGLVSLVRRRTGELQLAAHQGLPQPFVERLLGGGMEGTLCDLVYQSGEPLALADLAQGAPTEVGGLIESGFRSYLGVPLEARGGTLGTLCVFGQSPRTVKVSTLSLMRALGQQVGIAVENARLFEDAQRRAERERVIREISQQMQQATDVQSLMRITAEELNHLLGASRVYLRMGTQADLVAD